MVGTEVIIVDPENEYQHLASAVGGTYLSVSLNSPSRINPFDLPIAVDWPNRPLRTINYDSGKSSVTRWRLSHFDALRHTSHVLLEPLTGRTHQLRLHLQAIGHPILGDALYAPPEVAALSPRLLLHACGLGFTHPASGLPMRFNRESLASA